MFSRILLFSSVIALSACAYIVDEPTQDLTVITPGAHNAVCDAYINNIRYRFRPPQTIRVVKSKDDLVLDCLAPGNRRKKVVIEPSIERSFYGNVVTGVVPGAAWDYASEALFVYPSVIEVDFTNTPIREEALPAQNQPDIKQPDEYDLEEFRSGLPQLNADKYAPQMEVKRRVRPAGRYSVDSVTTSDAADSKVNLAPLTQQLGEDLNPAGAQTPGTDAPIPLFPGE